MTILPFPVHTDASDTDAVSAVEGRPDCLLIGFNDVDFRSYVDLVRQTGETSGAFRDLRLAYVDTAEGPMRALDVLNASTSDRDHAGSLNLSNMDFVTPAIPILAASLRRAGLSVDYINLFQRESDDYAASGREAPRVVAITTTLYVHAAPVQEVIRWCRKNCPGSVVVVGGPFVHNLSLSEEDPTSLSAVLRYLGADAYVLGREGEGSLAELVSAVKHARGLGHVPNVAYLASTGTLVVNPARTEDNPLGRSSFDLEVLKDKHKTRFASVRTAKSCPFSCAFCAFPARSGVYNYLPIDEVEEIFDALTETGHIDTISFIDDTFNVPRRRFHQILELMIRKSYGFRWNSFLRSDHVNEATIELMAGAGCEGVFLGVESGSDRILEAMNKGSRRRHYIKAITMLNEVGISSYASFIVGFPGEDRQSVNETKDLIREARPDYFRTQLWYCDPSTPVWDRRREFGISGSAFSWKHNSMTSQEAADIVDEFFCEDLPSTWLPQWGFEQWSTFYLQRLGWSRDQVRDYVKLFNAEIRLQRFSTPHTRVCSPSEEFWRVVRSSVKHLDPARAMKAGG